MSIHGRNYLTRIKKECTLSCKISERGALSDKDRETIDHGVLGHAKGNRIEKPRRFGHQWHWAMR